MEKLNFKVNAAIKNIIGKELIYSDSIAVVELIKNSKDAKATKANIVFKNETDLMKGNIIVSDNGKGMTLSEIKKKWLNIAYSEKKKSSDNIIYAGNKGVGRFSCDRLGSYLTLLTKSIEGDYIKLNINWKDFEDRDQDAEVSTVLIDYELLSKEAFLNEAELTDFNTGTVLKISSLRDTWPTNKLKKLISELEKFSPSLEDDFTINIFSENNDKDIKDKLNRKINNNILDKVSFKTTYIKSNIDDNGSEIKTTLFYQGQKVYTYIIPNPYKELKNISVELHYIDTIARAYFTKKMGIRLVDYGSVFLFYNNYRISPYGNPKNDWLGVDQRKGQGRARYFGTRELFGRIDITDKDGTFDVLTNREGLARNKAFHELIAYDKDDKISIYTDDENNDETESYGYIINIIRQLEAFIVDALDWNKFIDTLNPDSKKIISDKDILSDPRRYQMKPIEPSKIKMVCERLLKSNWNIKNLQINEDLIKHISEIANQKREDFLNDFINKVEHKRLDEMTVHEKGMAKKIIEEERNRTKRAIADKEKSDEIRLETEVKLHSKIKEVEEKEKEIEQAESENLFLRATSNKDTDSLLNLLHKIIDDSEIIRRKTNNFIKLKKTNSLTEEYIDEFISLIISKISSIKKVASFATYRNYKMATGLKEIDVIKFIKDYIKLLNEEKVHDGEIILIDELSEETTLKKKIKPLNLSIMIDNIISNSRKARSDKLRIYLKENKNKNNINIYFEDYGRVIDKNENLSKVFNKGYTTTNGSGLGLYQLKTFVNTELNGNVYAKANIPQGFIVELEVPCD